MRCSCRKLIPQASQPQAGVPVNCAEWRLNIESTIF